MVHRKSIPVQSLLYFNNFLEISYFFRCYNFKYIYFYNQIITYFIYNIFSNIFGFSINQLHIDYCKDIINIFIDFRNIAYFMKVGKVFKNEHNVGYRYNFLQCVYRYGCDIKKKNDSFILSKYNIYKKKSFYVYKQTLCYTLLSVYSFKDLVYKKLFVVKPKIFFLKYIPICVFISIFVYVSGCFLSFLEYIYWFYSFYIYLFSFIYRKYIYLFISYKLKSVSKVLMFKFNVVKFGRFFLLDLIDFIFLYYSFYLSINKSSSFYLQFLKRFFIFLFYNFIFFKNLWFFCFKFLNYFKYIYICWNYIKFFLFSCLRVRLMFLYTSITNIKYYLFSKFKLLNLINIKVKSCCNFKTIYDSRKYVFYYENIILKRFFNVIIFFKFMNYAFSAVVFSFNQFFYDLVFIKDYDLRIKNSILFKYCGSLNHYIFEINTMRRQYSYIRFHLYSFFFLRYIPCQFMAFYRVNGVFDYYPRLHFGGVYPYTLKFLFKEVKYRSLRYRGYNIPDRLRSHIFWYSNFFKLYRKHNYSNVLVFKKKIFYFFFFFIYKLEFVYQLLLFYNLKDIFYYYIGFFFKNWFFLHSYFKLFCGLNTFNLNTVSPTNQYVFHVNCNSKRFIQYFYRCFTKVFQNFIVNFNTANFNYLYTFAPYGFISSDWFHLNKLSLFECFKNIKRLWFFNIKQIYKVKFLYKNINIIYNVNIDYCILNQMLKLRANISVENPEVVLCNFGNLLIKLVNSVIYSNFFKCFNYNEIYYRTQLLLNNWGFLVDYKFSRIYIYSLLLEFNLLFLKGLSLLFFYFHFKFDFFFKFYFNLYYVNFVYFCEFFHYIFNMKCLFNFFFLKLSLMSYSFCGFLGLYLLMFKLSKNFMNITGNFILNYLYDIFYDLFLTNRYYGLKGTLRMLSNLFVDFLDLHKFCGFNFRIKGRLSRRTQRKRCFVINNGFMGFTGNNGFLFSGKRTLNTHIGSVSIYLNICLRGY